MFLRSDLTPPLAAFDKLTVATAASLTIGVVPSGRPPPLDEAGPPRLEVVHGARAEKAHGAVELNPQDLESLNDALRAARGEPVEVRLADADGVGAKSEGLGDVGSSLDAAVENNLDVGPDGLSNGGEDVDRGGRRVELASAVVGDPPGRKWKERAEGRGRILRKEGELEKEKDKKKEERRGSLPTQRFSRRHRSSLQTV